MDMILSTSRRKKSKGETCKGQQLCGKDLRMGRVGLSDRRLEGRGSEVHL